MSSGTSPESEGWIQLTFRVPPNRRDELVAELWVEGTRGVEIRSESESEVLVAYFEAGRAPSPGNLEVMARRCNAALSSVGALEVRDWLQAYRASCSPMAIGPLVIDPREPEGEPVSIAEDVLRIPARNAFGTGSHESTRLILEALVELEIEGSSVLDVGTGSAILALAALRRGARLAVGFDTDVGSTFTAADNARLNSLEPRLFTGTVEALVDRFDLVLVNILPHRWLSSAPAVVRCLRPDGVLLVSGLLTEEAQVVLGRLEALGTTLVAQREMGDWTCLELRSTP